MRVLLLCAGLLRPGHYSPYHYSYVLSRFIFSDLKEVDRETEDSTDHHNTTRDQPRAVTQVVSSNNGLPVPD